MPPCATRTRACVSSWRAKGRCRRDSGASIPSALFPGFFSRKEIGRYYASADIYLHASRSETFGNVLTEAMASGLAVAGFDYAAARQFIVHGRNGLVVPYDDPDALIEAGVMLATDDLLRAQLRSSARAAVEAQSWSSVIMKFEAELAEVAKVRLASRHLVIA